MLMVDAISWIITALSLAGKGLVSQIPLKWRVSGFILLAVTGVYWTIDLIEIQQPQMALLQMTYTLINVWGAWNAFTEIRHGTQKSTTSL